MSQASRNMHRRLSGQIVSQPSEEKLISWNSDYESPDLGVPRGRRESWYQLNVLSTAREETFDDLSPTTTPLSRHYYGAHWRPGFWSSFPLFGMLALTLVVFCTIASAIVAKKSDNQLTESWAMSPPVLFSILSAACNILLSYALAQGLVVSFWTTSLKGCTVAALNDNWNAGNSIWGAVRAAWRGNSFVNSLACILALLSMTRGPLLQRASTVVSGIPIHGSGDVELGLATTLPDEYGGVSLSTRTGALDVAKQMPGLTTIMHAYSSNDVMTMDHESCGDSCSTTIKGFGFGVECSQQSTSLLEDQMDGLFASTYFKVSVGLDIDSEMSNIPSPSRINFTTEYRPVDSTSSNLNDTARSVSMIKKQCILHGGIVAYDIILQNGTVQLAHDSYLKDVLLEKVEMLGPDSRGGRTVIGGFKYVASYLFASQASIGRDNAVTTDTVTGALANQFMSRDTSNTWSDPSDYMINQMRQIAFRASLQAAKDNATASNAVQRVAYVGTTLATRYITNYTLIGVAVALNLVTVLSVLATYWGWWTLGRSLSLSPLETAQAFDAPLLRDTEDNSSGTTLTSDVRNRVVKYRVAEDGGGRSGTRLQFTNI